jgi:hypothetical protein
MQKLELIKTKFEIAGAVPEGAVDRGWIRRNVLGLTEEEIEQIKEGRKADKLEDADVESGGSDDSGGAPAGDETAPEGGEEASAGGEEPLFTGYEPLGRGTGFTPVNPSNEVKNMWGKEINKKKIARSKDRRDKNLPDFMSMTSVGNKTRTQDTSNKPFGNVIPKMDVFEDDLPTSLADAMLDEKARTVNPRITQEMEGIFKKLSGDIGSNLSSKLLSEVLNDDEKIDLESE